MQVEAMNRACTVAERSLLGEEWASDWLTHGAWSANRVASGVLTLVLLIPEIIISIPRAIFATVPLVNLVYLLIGQLLYMILLGPVYGSSWIWREVKVLRPLVRVPLIFLGLPIALLGTVYASLWLMGGPQEGANKYYRKAVFESWPLTVQFMRDALDSYPYEL